MVMILVSRLGMSVKRIKFNLNHHFLSSVVVVVVDVVTVAIMMVTWWPY